MKVISRKKKGYYCLTDTNENLLGLFSLLSDSPGHVQAIFLPLCSGLFQTSLDIFSLLYTLTIKKENFFFFFFGICLRNEGLCPCL